VEPGAGEAEFLGAAHHPPGFGVGRDRDRKPHSRLPRFNPGGFVPRRHGGHGGGAARFVRSAAASRLFCDRPPGGSETAIVSAVTSRDKELGTMVRSGIGDAPKRREDLRFGHRRGHYLDDLAFDHLTHAVVLRSPYAHARIAAIDTTAAKAMPGVMAVLTAADAQADGLKPLLPYIDANTVTGEPFAFTPQPVLAADKVRYLGEPVALIVAD